MSPDDPRHGTYAGTVAHYFDKEAACDPCKEAGAAYRRNRRTRLYLTRSDALTVPAIGTVRRIHALVALGHPLREIDQHVERCPGYTSMKLKRYPQVCQRAVADMYAQAYDDLGGIRPEGPSADRARRAAERNGWHPPNAWFGVDIDDPSAEPDPGYRDRERRPAADLIEDFDWLVSQGVKPEIAAERLGVKVRSIKDMRLRIERSAA